MGDCSGIRRVLIVMRKQNSPCMFCRHTPKGSVMCILSRGARLNIHDVSAYECVPDATPALNHITVIISRLLTRIDFMINFPVFFFSFNTTGGSSRANKNK